jgi:hypothetical protein
MHYKVIQVLPYYSWVINIYYIIDNNQIGYEGAITLGNALQTNKTLKELDLCNYNIYYW